MATVLRVTLCLIAGAVFFSAGLPSLSVAERVQTKSLQQCGLGTGPDEPEFSTGTRYMVTNGARGAFLWDAETGALLRVFTGHTGGIASAVFSPDGTKVVTASSDRTAKLWDVSSGALLRTFTGHAGDVLTAVVSPDGSKVLTASADKMAKLWDVSTGVALRTFSGHNDWVRSARFSPDGSKVLTASDDRTARLWDAATGDPLKTFTHGDWVRSAVFSPDGSKVLTASDDRTAKLWDASTGAPLQTFTGHNDYVYSACFSPDGSRVLSRSRDGTARLWEPASSAPLYTLTGHGGTVNSAVFSPEGTKALTASDDKTARLWDVATGGLLHVFSGHTAAVTSAIFYRDATRVVTASSDSTARLWNCSTGDVVLTYSAHSGAVQFAAYSHSASKVLVGSSDNMARLWDPCTGALLRLFPGHTDYVRCGAFSPDDSMVVAGSFDGTATLWNASTGALLHTLSGHAGKLRSAAFSPDGSRVLTASDDWTARLWDATSGALLQTYSGHAGPVYSAVFSRNGSKVLTASDDGTAKLWDVSSSSPLLTYVGHTDCINSAVFSPDGTKVVTASDDRTARLWDASSGAPLQTFSGHSRLIWTAEFSPDGTRVLTASQDGTAKLWDLSSSSPLLTFSGHGDGVWSAVFSPDGSKVLTSGSGDSTIKLWNATTGGLLQTFAGHISTIRMATFSPDGRKVLTSGVDGATLVWEIDPPRALIVAGGGSYSGNSIAEQTDELGAYAYRSLTARGYTPENIHYLSAFPPRDVNADGDALNDVDSSATRSALQNALSGSFSRDAERLLVLMIDHGHRTGDFMGFRLNRSQIVSSKTLKSWLDDLQTTSALRPHAPEVTLAIDCCYSGQMAQDLLTTFPVGAKRTIVASTTSTAVSIFLPPPDLTSFMQMFLSSAYMGNSIGEAFRQGQQFFEQFPVAGQAPQIADAQSTSSADREFFGANWVYGVQSTTDINSFFPVFEQVMPAADTGIGTTASLWVKTLASEDPTTVIATLRPPAPDAMSGQPVTTLPSFTMARNGSDPRKWEVAVPGGTFIEKGVYSVVFTARFPYERVSNPARSSVTVSDGYDPDQTTISAVLAIGSSQDAKTNTALSHIASFTCDAFLTRFEDDLGTKRADWIRVFTSQPVYGISTQPPSAASVLQAIYPGTATDVGRLYVHLAGDSDVTGTIRLSPADELLTPAAFDQALDSLQASQTETTVVVMIDCPGAGAFMKTCAATGSQKRIVMAGGSETDPAVFLSSPDVSFSHRLLSAARSGATLLDSFLAARSFFNLFVGSAPGLPSAQPLLDDTGDGQYTRDDGTTASTLYLGRSYAFGDESQGLPFLLDLWGSARTVDPGQTVTYSALLIDGIDPVRVYARFTPPDSAATDMSSATLPSYDMSRDPGPDSWTWSLSLRAPEKTGDWGVSVWAEYPDAAGTTKLSEPLFATLSVAPPANTPDQWEAVPFTDDTASSSTMNPVYAGHTQLHTLDTADDVDWGVAVLRGFDDKQTEVLMPFDITLTDVTLAPGASLLLELFDNGPSQPSTEWRAFPSSRQSIRTSARGERQVWWRVSRQGSGTGAMRYRLCISSPTGGNNGIISQIGSNRVSVAWENGFGERSGASSERDMPALIGYRVARLCSFGTDQVTSTVIKDLVEVQPSGCPCRLSAENGGTRDSMCYEVVDEIPPSAQPTSIADWQSKEWAYRYEVYPIYSGGSSGSPWVETVCVVFSHDPGLYPICWNAARTWNQYR